MADDSLSILDILILRVNLLGSMLERVQVTNSRLEHTMITAMAAAGTSLSYAIDILLAQEVFYGQEFG